MSPKFARWWLVTVLCTVSVAGCQSPHAGAEQEKAAVVALSGQEVRSPTTRPQHEFRKLRTRLPGKSMREVAELLGTPNDVFNSGDRESWDYKDAAYDSVTGLVVSNLSIWFTHRVVDDVGASF